MATPHVTGAAALLSSYNPKLSAASLKATLMNTVDVLPQWNGIVKTGGRLNVARALQNQTVCTYTLDRTSQNVSTGGGTYSVNVSAPLNCDYTVTGGSPVIKILSGSIGSGNGTVTFQVSPTDSAGTFDSIKIAGQTFTIRQEGICANISLSPTSVSISGAGGRGTINVDTPPDCSVSATGNDSFITTSRVNQTFDGTYHITVPFTVEVNTGAARTGTVTVNGQMFTVNQAASATFRRKKVLLNPVS